MTDGLLHDNSSVDITMRRKSWYMYPWTYIYFQGVWSSFLPVYKRLKEELGKESIGDVKVVTASIGLSMATDVSFNNKESGGIVITLGVYMAHLAEVVFGRIKPETIHTAGTFLDTGLHLQLSDHSGTIDG